jgi:hypothetical protein
MLGYSINITEMENVVELNGRRTQHVCLALIHEMSAATSLSIGLGGLLKSRSRYSCAGFADVALDVLVGSDRIRSRAVSGSDAFRSPPVQAPCSRSRQDA